MTIEKFLAILVKRWWLVLLCFLTIGLGAYIGSKLMTPIYQSTALVQIAVPPASHVEYYSSLLASDQLVQTEATLATSDPVLREVASHYLGLTVAQLSTQVNATPKLNTQLFEINVQDPSPTRAAALANDIAATLIKQQLQMTLQYTVRNNSFLIIAQLAQPAVKPVRPSVSLNTGAGLAAGLLLGMSLAVLFEQLDTRIRTSDALTQLLGWPVLATIWRARSSKKEVVFNPSGPDGNIESYRILRTNIGFSDIDKPVHSLMVTSAMPGEGKTVIAANLAIFMAKAGKTTLLIDADLRNPLPHELFDLSVDKLGLSNAVLAFSMPTTTKTLDSFIHSVDIPNLWVMPSGPLPPNPSELLDSKAMQVLLTEIANSGVDIAIFDTPPLLGLSDASILASKIDGVLLVTDITRANKKQLKQAKALLMQAGARVLGCVVNKQRRSRHDTYSYYYYHKGEQTSERNHSEENKDSLAVPVSSFRQPKAQNGERNYSTEDTNSPTLPSNIFKQPGV